MKSATVMRVMVTFISAFAFAGVASAATIYGCVNDRNGSITIVAEGTACKKGASPLQWDQGGGGGEQLLTGPIESRLHR